jgi:hypothetical protein
MEEVGNQKRASPATAVRNEQIVRIRRSLRKRPPLCFYLQSNH